ncbi:MFS transporter [Bradyrhizobium sp. SZCCHNRI3037]|uniref:MFS transporter n=1 Tax=Bradyrhizobium sp. SZCCHNRI3037 TaxID=3057290 RepID=UPI0029169312|nr:MFS transporter [Bradyrhizobium sp. SZCCHNRI3037]
MKSRIGVYLSQDVAARLAVAVAVQRPARPRSALVEAALDRYLGPEEDDGPSVHDRLGMMSGQLEQLASDVRLISEAIALQARFQFAMAPRLPAAALHEACLQGAERFDEFAAQVANRVHQGRSLIRETLEKLSASGQVVADGEDTSSQVGTRPGETDLAAAVSVDDLQIGATQRHAGTGQMPMWLLILRVFLPFVGAYYLSYLFRTINATISGSLAAEFGLSAGNLGLLTSVYFLTFAAAQIPIGILLDRHGPRLVQSAMLLAAAAGAALFAVSDHFLLLLAGRALIGLGVAAALTSGLKALLVWFPGERVPLLNGLMIMMAASGAVTATLPADWLVASIGWRALFNLLALGSLGCSLLIYFVVPRVAPTPASTSGASKIGLRTIYADPRFWRLAPLSATCIGTAWSLQGLWAASWFSDVESFDRPALLQNLLMMAIALSLGALMLGLVADRLRRRGIGPGQLLSFVAILFIAAQLALILRLPLPSCISWVTIAAVGAATVLSYAVLAEYFPKEIAGRANAALNVFHIGGAFVLQSLTGLVIQLWPAVNGHYPAIAYQAAFGVNVALQIAAAIWFTLPWCASARSGERRLAPA